MKEMFKALKECIKLSWEMALASVVFLIEVIEHYKYRILIALIVLFFWWLL